MGHRAPSGKCSHHFSGWQPGRQLGCVSQDSHDKQGVQPTPLPGLQTVPHHTAHSALPESWHSLPTQPLPAQHSLRAGTAPHSSCCHLPSAVRPAGPPEIFLSHGPILYTCSGLKHMPCLPTITPCPQRFHLILSIQFKERYAQNLRILEATPRYLLGNAKGPLLSYE